MPVFDYTLLLKGQYHDMLVAGLLLSLQLAAATLVFALPLALLVALLPPVLMLLVVSSSATWIAFTLARASRLLISSAREFVADAEAARATQNPAATHPAAGTGMLRVCAVLRWVSMSSASQP